MPESTIDCVDQSTDCPDMEPMCSEPMVMQICPGTCNPVCQLTEPSTSVIDESTIPESTIDCVDQSTDCPAMEPLCSEPMVMQICPGTCNPVCQLTEPSTSVIDESTIPESTIDCVDQSTDCPAMEPLCSEPMVMQICPGTCNPVCQLTEPSTSVIDESTIPESTIDCVDQSTDCPAMEPLCSEPMVMQICPGTCNPVCQLTEPSTSVIDESTIPESTIDCVDQSTDCPAMEPLCSEPMVMQICPGTCNPVCQLTEPSTSVIDESTIPESTIDCVDQSTDCPAMEPLCSEPMVMQICPGTCNPVCQLTEPSTSVIDESTIPESTIDCVDQSTDCPAMEPMCSEPMVMQICPGTCNPVCQLTEPSTSVIDESTMPESTIDCVDQSTDCPDMEPMCSEPMVMQICPGTCNPVCQLTEPSTSTLDQTTSTSTPGNIPTTLGLYVLLFIYNPTDNGSFYIYLSIFTALFKTKFQNISCFIKKSVICFFITQRVSNKIQNTISCHSGNILFVLYFSL